MKAFNLLRYSFVKWGKIGCHLPCPETFPPSKESIMEKKLDLGTRLKVRNLLMDGYTHRQVAHLLHLSPKECRSPRCTSKIICNLSSKFLMPK